jgi:hypothetical protein
MKPATIRPYRCVCIECEPLPPIDGLHPLTYGDGESEGETRKPKGLLGVIAERVTRLRKED